MKKKYLVSLENKAVYTANFFTGGEAGAVMNWARTVMSWSGAIMSWAGAVKAVSILIVKL